MSLPFAPGASARRNLLAAALFTFTAHAEDFEPARLEISAWAWIRDASGTIQSGIAPVNLESDLAAGERQPQFFGRLTVKPGWRHRLFVEGSPYRLSGTNRLERTVVFGGQSYTVSDTVSSNASIDYVAGGYQYDLLSRPRGHFGVQGGVAYVSAAGTLRSASGFSGTETQSFPFPTAGISGRWFPLRLISVAGEVKGMSLGGYGHFLQASIRAGLNLGTHLTLEGGYMVVDADVHRKDQTRGFSPRFTGPLVGAAFRW